MANKRKDIIDLTKEEENVYNPSIVDTPKAKKQKDMCESYLDRLRLTPPRPKHMYNGDTRWQAENMNGLEACDDTSHYNLVVDEKRAFKYYYLFPHEISRLKSRAIVVDDEEVLLYDAGQLKRLADYKWYGKLEEAIVYREYRRETKTLAHLINVLNDESDDDNLSADSRDLFEHIMNEY